MPDSTGTPPLELALLAFAGVCLVIVLILAAAEFLRPPQTPTTEAARQHPHPTRPPVSTGRHARSNSTWGDQS